MTESKFSLRNSTSKTDKIMNSFIYYDMRVHAYTTTKNKINTEKIKLLANQKCF